MNVNSEVQPARASAYPASQAKRDEWILQRRGDRNLVDPAKPYAYLIEHEPAIDAPPVSVAAIFLTNRECPWRCVMCDLWRSTLTERVPRGAIPKQIDFALSELPPARQIKLYNSGSFFDPQAIPPEEDPAIAKRVRPFERVIVECHPSLIGPRSLQFRDLISGQLEVAIGLETIHRAALEKLNKRVTVERIAERTEFLRREGIDWRAFVLVNSPFLDEAAGEEWARRTVDFAFDQGARIVAVIPTRGGNGAMEELQRGNQFAPPKLAALERVFEHGLRRARGLVVADTWDLEKFADCPACFEARAERLRTMNLSQTILPRFACSVCGY